MLSRAARKTLLWAACLLTTAAQAYENADLPRPDPNLPEQYDRRTRDAAPVPASIPPVSERTGDIRIPVRAIRFDALPEFPELGLTAERIQAFAEQLRLEYSREDELVAGGFTLRELEQLAVTLEQLGARQSPEQMGPAELAQLVALLQQQQRQRGLSYTDIEDIARRISALYREQGLILATAYVPAQEIADGVVTLSILQGELGDIAVENSRHYSLARLRQPFESQLGKAVQSHRIEEALYLINDYPGLSVYGFFSRGERIGETRLNMQVREERRWRFSLRGDNYGSRFTGDERVFGMLDLLNPLGIGDQLSIGYLQSRAPVNSSLATFRYSLPLGGPRTRLQLSYDDNTFKLDDDSPELQLLDITGTNRAFALSVKHRLQRSRQSNLEIGAAFTDKRTELEAALQLPFPEEHVRGGELTIGGDLLSDRWRMMNLGLASLQYGEFVSEVADGRDTEFFKFGLDTATLLFWTLPATDYDTRFLLRSQWHYSESALPAFEQLTLGGAQGVRAFTVSDFSADMGVLLSAEWYLPLPSALNFELFSGYRMNDLFQAAVFADGAYGVQNSFEEDVADSWAHLSGWGLLFKLNWQDRFTMQVSFSRPLDSGSSLPGVGTADTGAVQTYLDFNWTMP